MEEKEVLEKLQECVDNKDPEGAHADADEILCKFLLALGYQEIVEKYNQVYKWYA